MGSFRTKTGRVNVTPERLTIERTGLRGGAAQALQGAGKWRTIVIYGLLAIGLAVQGVWRYQDGDTFLPFLLWGMSAWIVSSLIRSRNFSATPVIERDHATKIEVVKGIWGITRDRLIVHFRENDKAARRYILMPGVLQAPAGELERAVEALRASRWPVSAP